MSPDAARASLHVIHSADPAAQGQAYPIGPEGLSLGREVGNGVVISSDQASRRHARILVLAGSHVLQDLDSTNGTFVNSKPVKEQQLRHGDVVRIASTVMKYLVEG
ncbi:MAG: FHA domain-containing protein [Anaeromyxobacteraceae bacterium]|nr:FHA domain-containing protein [Anaeromyxobacteraceae bacterium]